MQRCLSSITEVQLLNTLGERFEVVDLLFLWFREEHRTELGVWVFNSQFDSQSLAAKHLLI